MVLRCCVRDCNVKGIKMHVLPKDLERRKWCEAINRPDLIDINESLRKNVIRICGTHFSEKDKLDNPYLRTTLTFDAVPSIVPGTSSSTELLAENILEGFQDEPSPSIDNLYPEMPPDSLPTTLAEMSMQATPKSKREVL